MEIRKIFAAVAAVASAAVLCSCGRTGYKDFVIPEQGESTLEPVDDIYIGNGNTIAAPKKEKTVKTVSSSDGKLL